MDGQKKFCIFKALRKDAVAIATPEERYENICKAERDRLDIPLANLFCALIILGIGWKAFYNIGFQNSGLFMVAVYLLFVLCSLLDRGIVFLWRRKKKRQLENGESLFYGNTIGVRYYWIGYLLAAGLILLRLNERGTYRVEDLLSELMTYMPVIIFGVLALIGVLFRPSAKQRMWVYWIAFAVGIFGIGGLNIYYIEKMEPENISAANVPLLQEDFKEVSGEPYIWGKQSESLLGKEYDYSINYDVKENETDQMSYDVYSSKYHWAIQRLWDTRDRWGHISRQEANDNGEMEDVIFEECKELWDAEEAWVSQEVFYIDEIDQEIQIERYCYEVRFPEAVMVIRTEDKLNKDEAQIIRDKLALK